MFTTNSGDNPEEMSKRFTSFAQRFAQAVGSRSRSRRRRVLPMADLGELDANERAFRARLKDGFRRFLTGDLGPGLGTKGAELLRTMTADQKDRPVF